MATGGVVVIGRFKHHKLLRPQERLALGNLNARRDRGFAGGHVEAIWMTLRPRRAPVRGRCMRKRLLESSGNFEYKPASTFEIGRLGYLASRLQC